MPVTNFIVAEAIRRYAATLALEGADRFKIKAYRRAAETIEGMDRQVEELVSGGEDLQQLPGIGKAISQKIEEIVRTGKLSQLDKAVANLKPELVELASRPRLDAKTVLRAYKKLGINDLTALADRLERGEIGEALGKRIEFHIRQGLQDRPRTLLYDVVDLVDKIEAFLGGLPGVSQVSCAGSVRRKQDTVGDLTFVVAAKSAGTVFKDFARFGGVQALAATKKTEAVYRLSSGLTVTLLWTPPDAWGLALLLATGSAGHIEELEKVAKRKKVGLSVKALKAKRVDASDEEKVYRACGLEAIPPELREGQGECQAASNGMLPSLVSVEDLKGDLHMHTTASDGAHSMAQMAAAAEAHGYAYIAITDHSQSLKITNGLTEKRLIQQIKNIDKLSARLKKLTVLKSAEVDILEDGRLDYSDRMLKELDFTVCSIHSRFGLNRQQQTERILRAMDNPYFNILGHATGRLLLKREGYELDIERILDHAKANGCLVEINSSPDRLDLSDEHARLAKDRGIKIAVNTDAHSMAELEFIHSGINQARRAWLEPADVLNTLSLPRLMKHLRR